MSGITKSHLSIPLPTEEPDEKQKSGHKWSSVPDKASWKLHLRCATTKDCHSHSSSGAAGTDSVCLVSSPGDRADCSAPLHGQAEVRERKG